MLLIIIFGLSKFNIISYLVNKRLDSNSIILKRELIEIVNLVVNNNKGLNIFSPEF